MGKDGVADLADCVPLLELDVTFDRGSAALALVVAENDGTGAGAEVAGAEAGGLGVLAAPKEKPAKGLACAAGAAGAAGVGAAAAGAGADGAPKENPANGFGAAGAAASAGFSAGVCDAAVGAVAAAGLAKLKPANGELVAGAEGAGAAGVFEGAPKENVGAVPVPPEAGCPKVN